MYKIVIIGASGLAKEAIEWIKLSYSIAGISGKESTADFGVDITPDMVGTKSAFIAIGNPQLKEKLYYKHRDLGFIFPAFVHPTSTVAKSSRLLEGAFIAPNCIIGPDTYIGTCSYINFSVGIGHDSWIGDFVQINPGVQIGGNTIVSDRTLIGSNATILENLHIGHDSIIGSGSVCIREVGNNTTVIGNPERVLINRGEE